MVVLSRVGTRMRQEGAKWEGGACSRRHPHSRPLKLAGPFSRCSTASHARPGPGPWSGQLLPSARGHPGARHRAGAPRPDLTEPDAAGLRPPARRFARVPWLPGLASAVPLTSFPVVLSPSPPRVSKHLRGIHSGLRRPEELRGVGERVGRVSKTWFLPSRGGPRTEAAEDERGTIGSQRRGGWGQWKGQEHVTGDRRRPGRGRVRAEAEGRTDRALTGSGEERTERREPLAQP